MPAGCAVALPVPVLRLPVFLGEALVLQCPVTALWNLSVSFQLDIEGLKSQTSDVPSGTESNSA